MTGKRLVKHGARGSQQVHQNRVKFDPYRYKLDDQKLMPNVVATMTSLCCRRCCEILQWKVDYGKYTPLDRHRKCNCCQEMSVSLAYHRVCQECAVLLARCAKCQKPPAVVLSQTGAENRCAVQGFENGVGDNGEEEDYKYATKGVISLAMASKYAFVEQEDSDEEFRQLRGLDIRQLKRQKMEMKKQLEKDSFACLRERDRRTALRRATKKQTHINDAESSDEEL